MISKSTTASAWGCRAPGGEWLEIGRGYESDLPDEHGGRRGKNSTSEIYIRNMFEAWLSFMAQDAPAAPRPAARAKASRAEIGA